MWRFATARAPGTLHLKNGLPCQDSLSCAIPANRTFVAAVADGAGSARMAEVGAHTAVQTIVRSVTAAFLRGDADPVSMLTEAAAEARDRLAVIAREHATEVRELACTLLAVIAGPQSKNALQIGDGVIVLGDDGSDWRWAFWPQHGEYANTTHFLTDEDATAFMQVEGLGETVSDIALTTDGLERLALHYASKSVYHPFFDGIFAPLHQTDGEGEIPRLSVGLADFLRSERTSARTDDDVSLVIATRRPQVP